MPEPEKILRIRTVLTRTGLSRSTIYRKIAEGTFPAQLKISTNGSGWHESDINRWIANPARWRATIDNDKYSKRDDRIDANDVVQRSSSSSSS
ncbi:helix-turn-helix transcriptional regulator [Rhizomicrobium electricum]|uniref:DNA-binding protein n=1 Tax=Rhizomicrobium electricum TaxID=480070 RepID=A0ABP3Q9T6_9PROT|nr:AlpA family phage regulatory protein [Rhizomicrobium electricum]NIJ50429.1 prophage regulatory protein [Rhizomicrobium electricum]